MKIDKKKKLAKEWFIDLQEVICKTVEEIEKDYGSKTKFKKNKWKYGEYRTINGKVVEKGGVAFSNVKGKLSKELAKKIPGAKNNLKFWSSGVSVILHPKSPKIPAMHFNTRFICTKKNWFGGGMDVTPAIKDEKEKKKFHKILKAMCDRHNKNYYKKYKKWCDEYFYLPHRKEPRGIGGIFFDYKKNNWEKDFAFVREVGITFKNISREIILKKNKKKWTKKDKEIQYEKRGRYVEFNLLYDRGTKFGLQTGGNVEAILMSLPPVAKWK